jgi:hypothetical protein
MSEQREPLSLPLLGISKVITTALQSLPQELDVLSTEQWPVSSTNVPIPFAAEVRAALAGDESNAAWNLESSFDKATKAIRWQLSGNPENRFEVRVDDENPGVLLITVDESKGKRTSSHRLTGYYKIEPPTEKLTLRRQGFSRNKDLFEKLWPDGTVKNVRSEDLQMLLKTLRPVALRLLEKFPTLFIAEEGEKLKRIITREKKPSYVPERLRKYDFLEQVTQAARDNLQKEQS